MSSSHKKSSAAAGRKREAANRRPAATDRLPRPLLRDGLDVYVRDGIFEDAAIPLAVQHSYIDCDMSSHSHDFVEIVIVARGSAATAGREAAMPLALKIKSYCAEVIYVPLCVVCSL